MATVSDWVKNLDDVNSDDDDSEDDDWVPPPEKEEEATPSAPVVAPEDQKRNEESERKRKANLWDSFLSDVKRPKTKDQTENISHSTVKNGVNTSKEKIQTSDISKPPEAELKEVKRIYDFAGEEIVVTEKVSIKNLLSAKSESSKTTHTNDPSMTNSANQLHSYKEHDLSTTGVKPQDGPISRGGSNLSSIVGAIGKKKKMGTLQKSALDWESFKSKEGESLQEELESHRKGKNSFLDRKDFLERVDWNQFQNERVIRQVERKRQNNLN